MVCTVRHTHTHTHKPQTAPRKSDAPNGKVKEETNTHTSIQSVFHSPPKKKEELRKKLHICEILRFLRLETGFKSLVRSERNKTHPAVMKRGKRHHLAAEEREGETDG